MRERDRCERSVRWSVGVQREHTSKVLHGFLDHVPSCRVQHAFPRLQLAVGSQEQGTMVGFAGVRWTRWDQQGLVPVFYPALAGQKVSATCICSWLTLVAEEAWRSILAPIKAGTPAPCQMTCRSGHPINLQKCREDACVKQRSGLHSCADLKSICVTPQYRWDNISVNSMFQSTVMM
jgi:hypothetical protein